MFTSGVKLERHLSEILCHSEFGENGREHFVTVNNIPILHPVILHF